MRNKGLLSILISSLLLSSCSATRDMSCGANWLLMGPLGNVNCNQAEGTSFAKVEQLPEGHSVIYVYRPYSVVNGSTEPDIYVNGKLYGELKNRGYFPVLTNESAVTIRIDKEGTFNQWDVPAKTITLYPKPGKTYYLRLEVVVLSLSVTGPIVNSEKDLKLSVYDENEAPIDISDTRLVKMNL